MFKFGTSGIRDLTINLIKDKVASSLAKKLFQMGWSELSIGRDGRAGSDILMQEFITNYDGKIKDFGIATTPEMASQQGLSVMVTASHNPSEYCGFKIYMNCKEQSTAELRPVPMYEKWNLLPKDIVIDCANGALGNKLKKLGFKNIINFEGEINKDCGATHSDNLEKYCRKNNIQIAFSVDGDADRVLMYLDDKILSGEELTFVLAKLLKYNRIVIDETMNGELCNHFDTVICKVGGQAVIQAMNENYINLGAEKSGHYYLDKNIGTSDALDAIIVLSTGYQNLGLGGLLKIFSKYKPYYQLNKNLKINDLTNEYEQILQNFKLPKGLRTVIRKSGTEPLLRIMIEGKNKKVVDKEFDDLLKVLVK